MGIALIAVGDLLRSTIAGDARYRVIDARTVAEYAAGHLPGAVHIGWEEWCDPAPAQADPVLAQPGYWGVLARWSPARYAEQLESLGLHSDAPIVVYAGGLQSRGREGRIAWMLLYLGAADVYLFDGGWDGWLAANGPSTQNLPSPTLGRFAVRVQEERRCTLAALRQSILAGGPFIPVDTRSQREFDGYEHAYLPRMGHLPGAILLSFASLFDTAGHYVTRDAYLARLPDPLHGDAPLVTYCEVGIRASTAALLHEIYTGRVAAVSDGSLMEWALDPTLPVHGVERGFSS